MILHQKCFGGSQPVTSREPQLSGCKDRPSLAMSPTREFCLVLDQAWRLLSWRCELLVTALGKEAQKTALSAELGMQASLFHPASLAGSLTVIWSWFPRVSTS